MPVGRVEAGRKQASFAAQRASPCFSSFSHLPGSSSRPPARRPRLSTSLAMTSACNGKRSNRRLRGMRRIAEFHRSPASRQVPENGGAREPSQSASASASRGLKENLHTASPIRLPSGGPCWVKHSSYQALFLSSRHTSLCMAVFGSAEGLVYWAIILDFPDPNSTDALKPPWRPTKYSDYCASQVEST
ncbi:hypothetical protein BDW02DRAFT_147439 [Decorospora gaudefroyi]|uniref:Uncharacterized protein n=1 Tax=Decorospora gaudefroyi TaxID=184978 RepID=A0A6A5JYM8_9PLEO|nr:hypothetical protein BDW02DRAFT_147439 [Decorospora gaudefroyi]